MTRKEGTPPRGEAIRARWGVALSGRTPGKKPATQPSKNLGGPVRIIATTILVFIISQLIAAFIAEAGLSLLGPDSHQTLDNSIVWEFVYILIAESLAVLATIRLVKRRGLGLGTIGLGRRPKWSDLTKAVIGFLAFYALLIVAGLLVNELSPNITNEKQDLGFTNAHAAWQTALAFISLVILPPLGEETLVRGYLYSGLRSIWRFWPALLVTSVLFGAAHLEFGSGGPLVWAAALDTFILSVVLVFLRERTGAIYAGILVHMLNNLVAFGYYFHYFH